MARPSSKNIKIRDGTNSQTMIDLYQVDTSQANRNLLNSHHISVFVLRPPFDTTPAA
jgi:hypothetical protein